MSRVLQSLGVRVRRDGLGTLLVDAGHLRGVQPAPDAVQQLRASFLVLGPLLARCGEARPAKGFHARRLFRNALFRRRGNEPRDGVGRRCLQIDRVSFRTRGNLEPMLS